ncbi:MAG: M28 family peptidase, partial [Planctomycetota bacterium]
RVRAVHRRIRSPLKLDLRSGRDIFARSDQFSFAQKGVVALFFFEADLEQNATYHRPADGPATMDGRKMALIAKLCAATAYDAAFDREDPASE